MTAPSVIERTLDAGPRWACKRSDHASRRRMTSEGGASYPGALSRASANAAVISLPRTPASVISFEEQREHEAWRIGCQIGKPGQVRDAKGRSRQRFLQRFVLLTCQPINSLVEQPWLQQHCRQPCMALSKPPDNFLLALHPAASGL